jgi:ferredoxin
MTSYLTVKQQKCIACGACIVIDSNIFCENDFGIAYNKIDNNLNNTLIDITPTILKAIDTCPAKAIIMTKK